MNISSLTPLGASGVTSAPAASRHGIFFFATWSGSVLCAAPAHALGRGLAGRWRGGQGGRRARRTRSSSTKRRMKGIEK